MKLPVRELVLLPLLGALMFAGDLVMDLLPNIHPVGMLIVVTTLTFRKKALWSVYVYVFLSGLIQGFSTWWLPHLYLWAILWGMVMLLPKKWLDTRAAPILCGAVAGLFGLLFGTLWAPAQAILMHLSFSATLAWIAAGLGFDAIHGASNFILTASLAIPLTRVLTKLNAKRGA